MEIALRVNEMPIRLGMPLHKANMSRAGFKKMGLLSKAFFSVQKVPGDIIYFPPLRAKGKGIWDYVREGLWLFDIVDRLLR